MADIPTVRLCTCTFYLVDTSTLCAVVRTPMDDPGIVPDPKGGINVKLVRVIRDPFSAFTGLEGMRINVNVSDLGSI